MRSLARHEAFLAAPTRGQFARDGAWEETWSFPVSKLPSADELRAYLAGREEIAFEVFFGRPFLGVRCCGKPGTIDSFGLACCAALDAAKAGEPFLSALSRQSRLKGWGHHLRLVEIGAVNAWQSIGAFRVASRAGTGIDFADLWRRLQDAPVTRDVAHPKAIEFSCDTPLAHWFAFPISTCREKSKHRISATMLRRALNLLSNNR